MSRSPRRLVLLVLTTALAACSNSTVEPTACVTDDQCPSSSRCQLGLCTDDVRPVAAIAPLGAVEEFALVELDGRGSSGGDGEGAPIEHVWTVRAVSAPCAAPEVTGREPVVQVRFGCPGTFEVALAVRDRLGLESAPAVAEVAVVPSTGTPLVLAGADVGTDHLCSGTPLVCRTADAVTLTARAAAGLAVRWSVEAPVDRALQAADRRVRFLQGLDSAETRVEIESDGGAISGDWIFRVEGRDAYGAVGAAYTRVSVRNRPPVITAAQPAPFPHVFDAARSAFVSAGEVGWSVVDPDGDPIVVSATWQHAGDGEASFEGALAPTTVSFRVEVPYTRPSDALSLRGGAELSRRIALVATDANRGEGRVDLPIEIGNRPPVAAGGDVDARVPHAFDPLRSRYVATARLGAWSDPDGDPLFAEAGVAPCDALSIEDGLARVECSVAYEGTPAVGLLAGQRSVAVRIRDPWADAARVPVYALEILNQAPAVEVATEGPALVVLKKVDVWNLNCPVSLWVLGSSFTATPAVSDPDGDPVFVRPTPAPGGNASLSDAVCSPGGCAPIQFEQPTQYLPCLAPYVPARITGSDGAASTPVTASPPLVAG